jgi:hypothetical protein
MTNRVLIKRSGTANAVPGPSSLEFGELAINYTDGNLFYKKADGNIAVIASSVTGTFSGTVTADAFVGDGSQLTNVSATACVVVSTNAPTPAKTGDVWIDSDDGTQYLYFDDGTSNVWAEMTAVNSFSSGGGSSPADSSAYSNQYVLTATTTNATETEAFVNGTDNIRVPVPADTVVSYTVEVACRRTDSPGDYGSWFVKGVAANSGGNVSDIGSLYEVIVARTDVLLSIDVRANNTTDSVELHVSGVGGKTFVWRAAVTTVEV